MLIALGLSPSNFVFLVQFKHVFFYFIKHFMKLCILHFDLILFGIFRARDWFHAHTIFDPCWQKTGLSRLWRPDLRWRLYLSKNFAETGTSNSAKVPSLQNMVSVVAHPIQAAIVFGELSNSHYPGGTLHLSYWPILVSFLWVHYLICPADCNKLQN